MTTSQSVLDRVDQVMPVIRDGAATVDRDGTFPTEQVAALADAGLLGLVTTTGSGDVLSAP